MSLTLDNNQAKFQIRAYQPGTIQVNDLEFTHSIIVTPEKCINDWIPQSIDELKREHLDIILELRPDILLIGTGSTLEFPDLAVYGELINHGIGVEVMNTHAACRTYNALTAEDRSVAAALIVR